MPTFMVFKAGEKVKELVGAVPQKLEVLWSGSLPSFRRFIWPSGTALTCKYTSRSPGLSVTAKEE